MHIGVLTLEFTLHGNESLKGKRNVAQSLKRKLRNKFNVSVAEVADQESHTSLVLAAAMVSSDYKRLQSTLNKALCMIEAISPEELTGSDIEIL